MHSQSAPRSNQNTYLIVQVGAFLLGIPSDRVVQVVRSMSIHPLPGAGPSVVGLSQFGGEPLVVLDLGHLAGMDSFRVGEDSVVVVGLVGSSDRLEKVGLAVDDALRLCDLGERTDSAEAASPQEPVVTIDCRSVRLLDISSFGGPIDGWPQRGAQTGGERNC